MRCPKCNAEDLKRGCSRTHNDFYNETYRKYICDICGHSFFTVEFVAENTRKIRKAFKEHYRCVDKEGKE